MTADELLERLEADGRAQEAGFTLGTFFALILTLIWCLAVLIYLHKILAALREANRRAVPSTAENGELDLLVQRLEERARSRRPESPPAPIHEENMG